MTIAELCLFGAVLLYLLTLAPVKVTRDFRNSIPRDPGFYEKTPIRTRALGAHINGIETFPFFAAAVLLAEMRHAPQGWIDDLAILFLTLRLAFVFAYLRGYAVTRTILWNVAFAANALIFFLPVLGDRLPPAPGLGR
jgi:uncharacterized MAPEG superfamily protein